MSRRDIPEREIKTSCKVLKGAAIEPQSISELTAAAATVIRVGDRSSPAFVMYTPSCRALAVTCAMMCAGRSSAMMCTATVSLQDCMHDRQGTGRH